MIPFMRVEISVKRSRKHISRVSTNGFTPIVLDEQVSELEEDISIEKNLTQLLEVRPLSTLVN